MQIPHRVVLLLMLVPALALSGLAESGGLRVVVGGVEVPVERTRSIVVESGALDVSAARVIVENARTFVPSLGDSLVIETTNKTRASNTIFKGEIVSIEPTFRDGTPVGLIIRGLDRLHRLNRSPRTRVFENQSDASVAAAIAREAGLDFGATGPEAAIRHPHIFQHNQTDLEFLRVRAARIGYEVWVEDTKLFFRRRGDSTVVPLACATTDTNVGATVRAFLPRTASPNVVKKVTVRGWNPAKAEEVDADATRPMIPLSQAATSLETPPGTTLDLGFVPALATIESAYGAANGTLAAGAALDLAAEAATDGDAALTAGAVISIEQVGSPFDGKYLVTGVSHRIERGDTEGWRTLLRLVRVDRALFVLPEVGDEVLVAFEQGDPRRPYVIGSLWSSDEPAPPAPFCVRRQD